MENSQLMLCTSNSRSLNRNPLYSAYFDGEPLDVNYFLFCS